jgi:hypothetical protein
MALANSTTRLGCGRDIDEVWANADAPPNAHEMECPDCQAARESLAELNNATRELRSSDREDPNLRLSADLVSKITSIARAEVRRGRRIPLRRGQSGTDEADLTVSEQAVATVIRHTCDQLLDIEARRCRVEVVDDAAGPPADALAHRAHLRGSVAPTTVSPRRIETHRHEIIAAIEDQVGVTAQIVDIEVEDVHDA